MTELLLVGLPDLTTQLATALAKNNAEVIEFIKDQTARMTFLEANIELLEDDAEYNRTRYVLHHWKQLEGLTEPLAYLAMVSWKKVRGEVSDLK